METEKVRLAGLVADIIGDGHLQGEPKWRIDYTSKDLDELERFNKEIEELFDYRGKVRKNNTNKFGLTYNLGINNKKIATKLHGFGAPSGNKVLKPFDIPDWILHDRACFKKFISRIFSCEACVDLYSKAIEFKMQKEISIKDDGIKFFYDIKNGLEKHFSIITTKPFLTTRLNKCKDGKFTIGIRIKLRRKEARWLFEKEIGFDDKAKQARLILINKGKKGP